MEKNLFGILVRDAEGNTVTCTEEFIVMAGLDLKSVKTEKVVGKISVCKQEFDSFINLVKTNADGSLKNYRFEVPFNKVGCQDEFIKTILRDFIDDTQGCVTILGAKSYFNVISAKSDRREVKLVRKK